MHDQRVRSAHTVHQRLIDLEIGRITFYGFIGKTLFLNARCIHNIRALEPGMQVAGLLDNMIAARDLIEDGQRASQAKPAISA